MPLRWFIYLFVTDAFTWIERLTLDFFTLYTFSVVITKYLSCVQLYMLIFLILSEKSSFSKESYKAKLTLAKHHNKLWLQAQAKIV